jgi:hypothetical protein
MRHVHSTTLLPMLVAALAITACEHAGPTALPAERGATLQRVEGSAQPPVARSYTTTSRESRIRISPRSPHGCPRSRSPASTTSGCTRAAS